MKNLHIVLILGVVLGMVDRISGASGPCDCSNQVKDDVITAVHAALEANLVTTVDTIVNMVNTTVHDAAKLKFDNFTDLTMDKVTDDVHESARQMNTSCNPPKNYTTCAEILEDFPNSPNGEYTLYPTGEEPAVPAYCDMKTLGGGWIVLQRRMHKDPVDVSFYQPWTAWQHFFGKINENMWLGLEPASRLTQVPSELRVQLWDFSGNTRYAHYGTFNIGPASNNYTLLVNDYSGDAGDRLAIHNLVQFANWDHDSMGMLGHCSMHSDAGWWYNHCNNTNINNIDKSGNGPYSGTDKNGIVWLPWLGDSYSLNATLMMFRNK